MMMFLGLALCMIVAASILHAVRELPRRFEGLLIGVIIGCAVGLISIVIKVQP